MPPKPSNVERTVDLSGDYQSEPATIDFYTNSAVAIGRDREVPSEGVWLDNLEKRALYEALDEELGE